MMITVTMRMLRHTALVLSLLVVSAPYALADRGAERQQRREDVRQSAGPVRPDYPREATQTPGAPQGGREAQAPQRLSREERRQLRNDIRDAGREIYRRPR